MREEIVDLVGLAGPPAVTLAHFSLPGFLPQAEGLMEVVAVDHVFELHGGEADLQLVVALLPVEVKRVDPPPPLLRHPAELIVVQVAVPVGVEEVEDLFDFLGLQVSADLLQTNDKVIEGHPSGRRERLEQLERSHQLVALLRDFGPDQLQVLLQLRTQLEGGSLDYHVIFIGHQCS